MSVSIIAIDIAKSVFQVVVVNSTKHPVFEHKFASREVSALYDPATP